jgi:hypothetical protein
VEDGNPAELTKTEARAGGYLLHNASGQEIAYTAGGNGLLTNPGNVSYQNATKTKILNFLAANPGMDGIFFDNFVMDWRGFGVGNYPVYDQNNHLLWSSPADFQAAQISFIKNVGAALKAAGYMVIVNARGCISGSNGCDDGSLTRQWLAQYYPYVTGLMVEYSLQRADTHTVFLSGDNQWDHHWDGWQSVEADAQSKGVGYYPLSYASSTELAQTRYFRGSFLLEWNGSLGSLLFGCWSNTTDNWNAEMAKDLGQPVGSKYQVATGVWRRDFSNGYVIVNPTASAVVLGGVSIPSGDAVLHQN